MIEDSAAHCVGTATWSSTIEDNARPEGWRGGV